MILQKNPNKLKTNWAESKNLSTVITDKNTIKSLVFHVLSM